MERQQIDLASISASSARQGARKSIRTLGMALVLAVGMCGGPGVASAQHGEGGIRKACASDYQSFCSGVQPGGGRIIACLQQNAGKLSPACQKALAARAGR